MAAIKHTKNELKAQREALRRYERFLPMLQLKKRQLQAEVQAIAGRIAEADRERRELMESVTPWVRLLSEPVGLEERIVLEEVVTDRANIAGVNIPVLREARLRKVTPDLANTPPWVDDAVETVGRLIECRVRLEILDEELRLVSEELRTTAQRVNLFEKILIPRCRENIRVIRIFLGDEQTAAVARGKIAKQRAPEAAAPGVGEAA